MIRLCSCANADDFDGDHGRSSAASSHARRTAGGGTEKIQNLSSPTAMRKAPSASPSVQDPHHGGADVGQIGADGIGPQRLELGVPVRLQPFYELQEVGEVSCPNRAVIFQLTQCVVTDEFVDLVARTTLASGSRWISDRSANAASTPRSAPATASAASRVKPPTKIANALSTVRSLALSQFQELSKIIARLR